MELEELKQARIEHARLVKEGTVRELANKGIEYLEAYLEDEDADLTAIESALDLLFRLKDF